MIIVFPTDAMRRCARRVAKQLNAYVTAASSQGFLGMLYLCRRFSLPLRNDFAHAYDAVLLTVHLDVVSHIVAEAGVLSDRDTKRYALTLAISQPGPDGDNLRHDQSSFDIARRRRQVPRGKSSVPGHPEGPSFASHSLR